MATVLSNEPEGEDEMTQRQVVYIGYLLEARRVSARCASTVIGILEEQPRLSDTGLGELRERIEREST